MNLTFCRIGRGRQDAAWTPLISSYLQRIRPYASVQEESPLSEERLWTTLEKRNRAFYLVLLDSRGKQLSSVQFAEHLRSLQDTGHQDLVFCIGPADGFSAASLKRANLLLSFGPMTLPHQMAALVLSEQLYRAFTILAGHPYHSGH
ncbi:MAG TPA: 23S rRNA (pseudouridine(1915)-N(3))-methyltransferase RlmH [Edaphobacter sp.]